jgi:glyoxylase-like metal-dependent hydrolase (beta-lactamase superfamily II)
VVYLPSERIVFTGDIIATQRPDPIIHPEKNGSSEGWIKTVQGIVKLDADQFVPGHGDVQSKADIQARLKSTEDKRTKIVAMVKEGKSLDDIKVAMGDNASPAAPVAGGPGGGRKSGGGRGPGFASLSEIVYNELKK